LSVGNIGYNGASVPVIGGAGFIGSELVHKLTNQGAKVVAVDNLVNGRPESLRRVPRDRFQLAIADIRDSECVADSL